MSVTVTVLASLLLTVTDSHEAEILMEILEKADDPEDGEGRTVHHPLSGR